MLVLELLVGVEPLCPPAFPPPPFISRAECESEHRVYVETTADLHGVTLQIPCGSCLTPETSYLYASGVKWVAPKTFVSRIYPPHPDENRTGARPHPKSRTRITVMFLFTEM